MNNLKEWIVFILFSPIIIILFIYDKATAIKTQQFTHGQKIEFSHPLHSFNYTCYYDSDIDGFLYDFELLKLKKTSLTDMLYSEEATFIIKGDEIWIRKLHLKS